MLQVKKVIVVVLLQVKKYAEIDAPGLCWLLFDVL
jgi:hypothetical protein